MPEPWEDPRIQGFLREWIQNAERCLRQEHPRLSLERFGRMVGVTNTGGQITINYEPDGIPNTIIPNLREYFYLFVVHQGIRQFPLTPQQFALARLNGTPLASLRACTP